ncbi:hypothetical protein Sjap_015880 [Stephania japonica]|uniref:glutathione transferase n=1 Tax=Stephania japonica TaxID=461633 RepID=A0AAP0NRT1_9MAGN
MVLGAWASPFAIRPRIALTLKSIDYEYIEENLRAKSDLLVKSNPVHKKVPVLLHGDRPICESLVILQYIDEQWSSGPSILPSDPYDRAIARFWVAYVDDKFFPALAGILKFFPALAGILKAQSEEAKAEALGQVKAVLELLEEALKDCGKGGAFYGGERIGYVDIAFGSYVGWVRAVESMGEVTLLDEERLPGLVGWTERFCSHEAVKDVMPETEKLIEFAKKLFSKPT